MNFEPGNDKPNRKLDLNLNLDILYGCKWSCGGCHVNTKGQIGFDGNLPRILRLVEDFKNNGFFPSILTIAPTDVFTAKNSIDAINESGELIKHFGRIGFNTTFLELDQNTIDTINTWTTNTDKEVEFKIVVEAKQFTNDKYLSIVRDNMLQARDQIQCANFVIHPQFNLFDYRMTKLDTVLENYEGLNERSYQFFGQGIDYVLSFSRSNILSKQNKLNMLKWIQNMFNKHVTVDNAQTIHFDAGNKGDFQEHIYTYRNGKFFYAPKIYDDYVCFDDEMLIPMQRWDCQQFVQFENNLIVSQYNNINDKDCATCQYAPTCTSRGIPFFMDYIGTKECIMPKQAFDVINSKISTWN